MTRGDATESAPAGVADPRRSEDGMMLLAVGGGVLAWLAVLMPAALDPQWRADAGWPWFTLMAAYLAVFLADVVRPLPRRVERLQAGALLVLGMACILMPPTLTTTPILTVTTTVTVAAVLSLPWTLTVAAVQMLAVTWVVAQSTADAGVILIWIAAYSGFQLFAIVLVQSQARAAQARDDLDRAHAELRSRHQELADAHAHIAEVTREAERLRIARDLHDTMGHQLTALALNLEALTHVTADTPAATAAAQCRDLARELLTDVRTVVGQMRADQPGPDLVRRLTALAEGSPLPTTLVIEDVPHLDAAQETAIFRGAQEALTNAARHAHASRAEVTLRAEDGELILRVVDDGPGSNTRPTWGNGLSGMAERFSALGGLVTATTSPGQGFRLVGRLPLGAPQHSRVREQP